jgi:hypothetical protein
MTKKSHIKVVKVYMTRDEKPSDKPQAFPRIPQLYLELLENKDKIKQDLVNKEHVPASTIPVLDTVRRPSSVRSNEKYPTKYNKDDRHSNTETDKPLEIVDSESDDGSLHSGDEIRESINKNRNNKNDRSDDKDDRRDERSEDDRSEDDIGEDERDEWRNDRRNDKRDDRRNDKMDDRRDDKGEDFSDDDRRDDISDLDERNDEQGESVRSKDSENDLSNRLKELLNDTDDEGNGSVDSMEHMKRGLDHSRGRGDDGDKYSRKYDDKFKHKSSHRSINYRTSAPDPLAPSLAELHAQGAYDKEEHLRDINQVNMSDDDNEDKKRELLFKFDLLRKSYPNSSIPEFSIHSDLSAMHKAYEDSVRRLSLDSAVENYKTYLIGGFMLVEFIFGSFLGLDMQGFTQQQILSMNSYEKLLIELGEKSYVPTGSRWPVEIRLLFLVIMNAAFFIVSKMIMKKTGSNLMNMINGMNASSTPAPQRKRKMRGPNINLDEIPTN